MERISKHNAEENSYTGIFAYMQWSIGLASDGNRLPFNINTLYYMLLH